MGRRLELLLKGGPLDGRRFSVSRFGVRLGRSSSNDIHVPDQELSRNHCFFESEGEGGIRVSDLTSANGTYVNGEQLGETPRSLAAGDVVEAGSVVVEVVVAQDSVPPLAAAASDSRDSSSAPAAASVDLGLDQRAAAILTAAEQAPVRRHRANLLMAIAVALAVGAMVLVMVMPSRETSSMPVAPVTSPTSGVMALEYEKVEADAKRIFRYELTLENGQLHVVYDDVPGENRHADKSAALTETARARIDEIFSTAGWDELDGMYCGAKGTDENALVSWRIRVIRNGRVKEVLVANEAEPDAFHAVREALETFSRNELGMWAIQYSRERLLELSAESERLGDAKLSERDVEFGNVAAAVAAYREALFYLETVNPRPEGYPALKGKLRESEGELAKRYREQRFLADRAINLADWETARKELRILCDIVPDRVDPRNAEASAKLVDVENRLKKAKKGGQ